MLGLFNDPFLSSAADWLPVLLDAALKGIVILLFATVVVLQMRRTSASARHLIWFLAVAGLLLLPVFSTLLPEWQVRCFRHPLLLVQAAFLF